MKIVVPTIRIFLFEKIWWLGFLVPALAGLHTVNPFYAVDYIYRVCYQNGGLR